MTLIAKKWYQRVEQKKHFFFFYFGVNCPFNNHGHCRSKVEVKACDLLPCGICDCDLFEGSSIHLSPQSSGCSRSQMREDTRRSEAVYQAGLSDNRWDVECLPGLSTQEECVHACAYRSAYCVWWWTPAGEVLPTPYETCWRMIT